MKRSNQVPQGLQRYLQNWPQQPLTECLCKIIQETRAQPPHVTGDILLKPHPYEMEMQHPQAGRQFYHPPPPSYVEADEMDPGIALGSASARTC